MKPSLSELILWSLAETLDSRPSRPGQRIRIGAVVVDEGDPPLSLTISIGSRPLVTRGVEEDADLMIVTNATTLVDLVHGSFDAGAPGPEHLFVYSGSVELIAQIADGLGRTRSWLDLQVEKGARR